MRRLDQLPGFVLWILSVEVRKEGGVGEMLEARSVVSHDIGFPWEVLQDMAVAMLPLVFSSVDALLRCWSGRANSIFTDS